MKTAVLMIAVMIPSFAHAETVAQKKQRAAIDESVAKASSEIKDCGKKFKVTFDWKAYDAIDWKTLEKDKYDYLKSEQSNLADLAMGFNQVCADKDYKAALSKILTIVYKPTNNDTIDLKAVISGGTLTLENYSFGSTRHADAYETALKGSL